MNVNCSFFIFTQNLLNIRIFLKREKLFNLENNKNEANGRNDIENHALGSFKSRLIYGLVIMYIYAQQFYKI